MPATPTPKAAPTPSPTPATAASAAPAAPVAAPAPADALPPVLPAPNASTQEPSTSVPAQAPAQQPAAATNLQATPAPEASKDTGKETTPKEETELDLADSSGAGNPNDEELEPEKKKGPSHALPIGLGILSAALIVAILFLSSQISDRNTTINQNKNRMVQMQNATDQLLTQAETDKAERTKLQEESAIVLAEAHADRIALDKTKAETAALRIEAEELRARATDFQTQMTQAQVTAIRHQGEVEIAEAKTAVAITGLNNALAKSQILEDQLSTATSTQAATQLKLSSTEKQLALLQKSKSR